jgi:hypothetical protein
VTALLEPAVVDELGIGALCPAARRGIDLVGKGADGNGDGDTFRAKKASLLSQ